jgi:hypothetical protein
MNLSATRAHVERLHQLAHGMGKEAAVWKAQEGPLLPKELRLYVSAAYVT